MEVIAMSPSPSSPTDGDDPCGIDVTSVAIHSVTLLICLCGLAGNGAFHHQVSISSFTHFMNYLAFADFLLLLLLAVPSTLLFLLEDVFCSTLMPPMYLSLLFRLSLLSYQTALFWMMLINIQSCQSHQNQQLLIALHRAFFFIAIGFIVTVTSLWLSQGNYQEVCIFLYIFLLLLFVAPLVISATILLITFIFGSQQEQLNMLDCIIFSTILCSFPLSLCILLQQLGYTKVSSQVLFLFTCIQSSIKPIICSLLEICQRPHLE